MTKTYSGKSIFLLLLMLCLLLASCSDSSAPLYKGPAIKVLDTSDLDKLEEEFQRHSYRLDNLDNGVPPLILHSLPKDLPESISSQQKKRLFFKSMLPMVLLANEEVRRERTQLKEIKLQLNQQQPIDSQQQLFLINLAKRYKVASDFDSAVAQIDELLNRVDIIPPDLALAQAANESAWGTSRFSLLGNNLFGEWTFTPGTGIVPEGRPEGATYEVRRFASVYDSIRSYLRNINTHQAYDYLRQKRAEMRAAGNPLSGADLAEGLLRYSERGEDYVRDLQVLIRQNRLNRFAGVNLRNS